MSVVPRAAMPGRPPIGRLRMAPATISLLTRGRRSPGAALSNATFAPASTDRAQLSRIWLPTGGISASQREDAHAKLIRAGFLRQSHSGIFHLLPLGLRVQEKLSRLIERHMQSIGASKVALSSITSEALWESSGRLSRVGSELFRFRDRRDTPYMLSPTHEEEITTLVSRSLHSYRDLPLRLFQITPKYRDELRPRHGLLRTREFMMKDLYTFDRTRTAALDTYRQVQAAYARIFAELRLPYLVAEASSGDMGGELSHEYLLPDPIGEDLVAACDSCSYAANDEVAQTRVKASSPGEALEDSNEIPELWRGISKDRKVLVNVWYPKPVLDASSRPVTHEPGREVNIHAIKSIIPQLDAGVDDVLPLWHATLGTLTEGKAEIKVLNLVDFRLQPSIVDKLRRRSPELPIFPGNMPAPLSSMVHQSVVSQSVLNEPLNLMAVQDGDACPRCEGGTLRIHKALELGHTFHLGTRYSAPLGAAVTPPTREAVSMSKAASSGRAAAVAVEMGCHGIGVSRLIGAMAEHLADDTGLNWPCAIAPFEVVVIARNDLIDDATVVYDSLARARSPHGGGNVDVALDDRGHSLVWKMKDADLIGYPVLVILGNGWEAGGTCEVQCRRLGVRQPVTLPDLVGFVKSLLDKL